MVDTVLRCDCGFEASAVNEDELVAKVQRHAREAHGMALTHEEALLLTFRAELRANESTAVPRKTAEGGPT